LRVHHIINDYSMFTGGAQRVVRSLHAGLRQRKIESHILGLMQQKDDVLDGAQSLALNNPYTLKALQGINRYLDKYVKPDDILHVHLFPSMLYASFFFILGRVPCHLVCTEHSTSNRRRGTLLGRSLDTFTYAGYEQVIAISMGVEQELLDWKPELKGRTKVIYNGVNLNFAQVIRREPKAHLIVLSVGNLRPAKNYEQTLAAIALLKDFDFEYQIAGEGASEPSLRQLCRELGIESKVKFLGYVHSVSELLASADIFLMPSKWEGFGIAAVEAMNAGLPVILSDIPGLREIADDDSSCAFLVNPEDPHSIAQAVERLLVSPELRTQLGESAFRRAQKFGVDQMVEKYIRVYEQLL
jgi:glycosyltransferase involved in cell wall biosynthesis